MTARQPLGSIASAGVKYCAAGVVDEHVEAAVAVEAGAHDALGIGVLAYVAADMRGALAELLHGGRQDLLPTPGDHHARAAGDELARCGQPQPRPAAGYQRHTFVQKAFREHLRPHRSRHRCRWYERTENGQHHGIMQIPGVHIETLHNPVRYTYAQIEKACAIAQMLNRESSCWSNRPDAERATAPDQLTSEPFSTRA